MKFLLFAIVAGCAALPRSPKDVRFTQPPRNSQEADKELASETRPKLKMFSHESPGTFLLALEKLETLERAVDTALVARAPTLERSNGHPYGTICEFPCTGGCHERECSDNENNIYRSWKAYNGIISVQGSKSDALGIEKVIRAGKEVPAPATYYGGYDKAVLKAAQDAIDNPDSEPEGSYPPPGSYPPGKVKKTPVVMFVPSTSQAKPAKVCALVRHGFLGGSSSASGTQGRYDPNIKIVASAFATQGVCTFSMECQHGEVTSSASTQVDDVRNVVDGIMRDLRSDSKEFAYLRKTCACESWALAGHSMGSAITFHAAADLSYFGYNVIGQIIISPPFSAGGGLVGRLSLGDHWKVHWDGGCACENGSSGKAKNGCAIKREMIYLSTDKMVVGTTSGKVTLNNHVSAWEGCKNPDWASDGDWIHELNSDGLSGLKAHIWDDNQHRLRTQVQKSITKILA